MAQQDGPKFEVNCPCCGARLTIDAEVRGVIAHQAPSKPSKAPDFDQASQLLEKEKARRESLFNQSAEDEKSKSKVLERKFQEALEKSKDEPVTRPMRDIDLD